MDPEMRGKTVLVTGASSGVGRAAAKQLARQGAQVLLVCRDRGRGVDARLDIAEMATGPRPVLFLADLSSQAEVRALALEVRARVDRIDVLVNNAGAMFAQRELTGDGIEKTLAINHLAPFLLTALLFDLVRVAPSGRIVTVASESHSGSLDFANLQGERHYNFFAAYNRSKLGNLLFTYELARRVAGMSVTANAVSPGPTRTSFGDRMRGLPGLLPRVMKQIPFLFVSADEGARTLVHLASAVDLADVSGRFYLRGRDRRTRAVSYDAAVASQLWTESERLTRQKFL